MSRRAIYLSGPISGAGPDWSEPFMQAEAYFREHGWDTVNPATLGDLEGEPETYDGIVMPEVYTLRRYLARDFRYLAVCDAIALLPGWSNSRGANAELAVALMADMDIYYFDPISNDHHPIDPKPKREIVELVVGGFE